MKDNKDYHKDITARNAHSEEMTAVALVHYGAPETTWRCIRSLIKQEGRNVSIVVADHGPGPDLVRSKPPEFAHVPIHIIRADNLGFGKGCNIAADFAFEAGAPYVWFLNNDAILTSPLLARLRQLAEEACEGGLWGTLQRDGKRLLGADAVPKWFPIDSDSLRNVVPLPPGCHQLSPKETLSGASILISKQVWDRLGPWPEWCFLYYEDVAWCLKAHDLGIPLIMTDLEILHERNTTTGHHSPTTTYYGVRNSLLLHQERWPKRKLQRAVHAFHLMQKRLFQGNFKMLSSTLQGIWDAWKGRRSVRRL